AGGMPPITLAPLSGRYLSFAEREEIAILHAQRVGSHRRGKPTRLDHLVARIRLHDPDARRFRCVQLGRTRFSGCLTSITIKPRIARELPRTGTRPRPRRTAARARPGRGRLARAVH